MSLASPYIETRNGGFYVAGSRIPLDVIYYDYQRGRSPEAILAAYPSLGSTAKVYGAIAFILDHADEVEAYLHEQERLFSGVHAANPMSDEMAERFEHARRARFGSMK